MAKRKAVYDPAADKRWAEKNPERRKYLSHRGRARSFIRNAATLEDLYELEAMIEERKQELAKTTSKSCEIGQDRDA